ncbi:hypothetical protein [Staphylococcus aureus]|uniref:hypothetical protein n=2 Tax=Staphylococcus aureus TaxID=1280 RepID=UPI0020C165F8|nr:hypothetical protein [Staphylococcus aureus]
MEWGSLKRKFSSMSEGTKDAIEIKAKNAKLPLSKWDVEDMKKVIVHEQETVADCIKAIVQCKDEESAKVIAETHFMAVIYTQQLTMAYHAKMQGKLKGGK